MAKAILNILLHNIPACMHVCTHARMHAHTCALHPPTLPLAPGTGPLALRFQFRFSQQEALVSSCNVRGLRERCFSLSSLPPFCELLLMYAFAEGLGSSKPLLPICLQTKSSDALLLETVLSIPHRLPYVGCQHYS